MPKQLAAILANTYQVGILAAPPTAILWAADALMAQAGAEIARRELSALNRKRIKAGKMPAYAPFGSPLF
jgi:hypothetical protein